MAHLLIHRLRALLAPGCLPSFTSDGLNAYFYALTAHFGDWITGAGTRSRKAQWRVKAGLLYGQVQKQYRRRKLVRVRHVIRLGTWSAYKEALQALGFSGRVNTAFIKRVNLTIRRGVAALARRTWATALQGPHLEAHLHWWLAYYHFVRPMSRCVSWYHRKPERPRRGDHGIGNARQLWRLGERDIGGPPSTF